MGGGLFSLRARWTPSFDGRPSIKSAALTILPAPLSRCISPFYTCLRRTPSPRRHASLQNLQVLWPLPCTRECLHCARASNVSTTSQISLCIPRAKSMCTPRLTTRGYPSGPFLLRVRNSAGASLLVPYGRFALKRHYAYADLAPRQSKPRRVQTRKRRVLPR